MPCDLSSRSGLPNLEVLVSLVRVHGHSKELVAPVQEGELHLHEARIQGGGALENGQAAPWTCSDCGGQAGTASLPCCGLKVNPSSEVSVQVRIYLASTDTVVHLLLSSSWYCHQQKQEGTALSALTAIAEDDTGLTSTFRQPRRSRCRTRRPRILRSSGLKDVEYCCWVQRSSCELKGPP